MPQQNSPQIDLSDLPDVDLSDIPDAKEEAPSIWSKAKTWATTPLFGPSEPTIDEWASKSAGPEMQRRSGWAQSMTPLNLVMEAGGGGATLAAALKLRNMMRAGRGGSEISSLGNISPPSVARSVSDIPTGPLSSGIVNLDEEAAKLPGRIVTNINQMPTDTASILQTAPTTFAKPKVRVTAEGQVTSSDITPNATVRPEFKDTRGLNKRPGSALPGPPMAKTPPRASSATGSPPRLPPVPPEGAPGIPRQPFDPNNFNPEDFTIIMRERGIKNETLAQKIWDTFKAYKSVDLPYMTSAAFRQGNPWVFTKPWREAWGKAASAYGDEVAAEAMEAMTLERELFKPRFAPKLNKNGDIIIDRDTGKPQLEELKSFAEEAGLNRGSYTNREAMDDFIGRGFAESTPIYGRHVKGSNRAYTAFMNHIGDTVFEDMWNEAIAAGKDPAKDLVLAKQIAEFVNTSLKRGTVGVEFGKHHKEIGESINFVNNLVWSPRAVASEFRMINPTSWWKTDPMVRQAYLATNMRRLGIWMSAATLMNMSKKVQVNTDITNSDFGKIKVGDTRFDPPGGMQQFLVLLGRIGYQSTSSSTDWKKSTPFGSGPFAQTTWGAGTDFLGNKLHPGIDTIRDITSGTQRDPTGIFDRAVFQTVSPMFIDDIKAVVKSNPYLLPVAQLLSATGMGVQTYGPGGKFNEPKFLPNKYDVLWGR